MTRWWWRWWRERGSAERMDVMVRWPLYLFSATEPALVLLAVNSRRDAWGALAAGLLAVSVAHAVACVAVLRAGLAAHLGGPRPPARLVAVVVVGAAVVVAGSAAVPGFTADPGDGGIPVTVTVAMIAGGALTGAVAPLLRTPALLGCVLAGGVLVGAAVAGGLVGGTVEGTARAGTASGRPRLGARGRPVAAALGRRRLPGRRRGRRRRWRADAARRGAGRAGMGRARGDHQRDPVLTAVREPGDRFVLEVRLPVPADAVDGVPPGAPAVVRVARGAEADL